VVYRVLCLAKPIHGTLYSSIAIIALLVLDIYSWGNIWLKVKHFLLYLMGFLILFLLLLRGVGGVFKLELFLPEEYPMAAQKVNLPIN
jgi:hypothetical protein